MAKKSSLRARLGAPPTDDSLATVNWMVRALGELANEVVEEVALPKARRRAELLKIADRMAKLRDLDRIGRAEDAIVRAEADLATERPGPELTDAGDLSQSTRPIATRRGQPRTGSLR